MAPNLSRLTSISQQPSLKDYKPHHHTLSLSSILHPQLLSKESSSVSHTSSAHGGDDDKDGSFRIFLYDTLSEKVKELVLLAEGDFDSKILDILVQPHKIQAQEALPSQADITINAVASAPESDPFLCEAVLRSVYAQGSSQLSLQDRHELAENVKRAFSLSGTAFREARMRAIKASQHRQAEVQAQLDDLRDDKNGVLNPRHFESWSFYEECKAQELEELGNVYTTLQTLPSISAQIQVAVLSVWDSNADPKCLKRRMCYGPSIDFQVYCTVKVVPASQSLDDGDGKSPDYITKLAGFIGHAEWQEKSPWIPLSSVDDRLCVTMWKKKGASTLRFKGSKELELLRNISQRKKKITWTGDKFLGQLVIPLNIIETQALSTGNIRGNLPAKFYSLSNVPKEKFMFTLELQISFYCEFLLNNDALHDKVLFQSPIADVEAGFYALVQVAYAMHLEGELKLEENWERILSFYGAHYRLRREMSRLAVLKHLARMYQPESEYLEFITSELKPICKNAKEGKLRKVEYSLLTEVITLMIKPSLTVIEDFQSVLPGQHEVITKLIELLSLLLCWDPNPIGAKACFKRWVKISCVQRFNKHLSEGSSGGEITSKTFGIAISLLQNDLRDFYTCFKNESLEELGLFETCAVEYYRLISQYITEMVGSVRISSTDLEELTQELLLLHQELERSNMKMEFIDLHGLLHDHIIEIISSVKPRMIDWIISNLNEEKWEPVSLDTDALFSYSVVDLYYMVNGVVENLTSRLSYFPFGKHYYVNLEEALCSAIETYVRITERMCLQELPSRDDDEHHIMSHFKAFHSTKALCISKTLSVKLNNLHSVLQQQSSLEEILKRKWESHVKPSPADFRTQDASEITDRESKKFNVEEMAQKETFGQHFKTLKDLVKLVLSNVTGSILANMQNEVSGRLQKLMIACSLNGKRTLVMEDLDVLTKYFDGHLKALNEWLDPDLFRNLLLEIAATLIFCMEEFALNRDEDPHPMTAQQRDYIEQTLDLFYSYFYGDGVGILESEMDRISRRLRRILACSDLDTHELCTLYWKAWDRFSEEETLSPSSTKEQEVQVLDFLLLLQQRNDDEAQIIVTNQKRLAKTQMMQLIFGLPKDEDMVASFTCRNSKKQFGTLFITAKHVSFADAASMPANNDEGSFIIPFERLRQVTPVGYDSLSFIPYSSDKKQLSRFSDREAVLRVIYNQVKSTGSFLEMYLTRVWGKIVGVSVGMHETTLKRFSCSRQGLISKHRGSLTVSASCLIFEPENNKKISFVELGDISKVHAERKGLRASGVVIESKSGNSLEFVDFEVYLNPKEIALDIGRLVKGRMDNRN